MKTKYHHRATDHRSSVAILITLLLAGCGGPSFEAAGDEPRGTAGKAAAALEDAQATPGGAGGLAIASGAGGSSTVDVGGSAGLGAGGLDPGAGGSLSSTGGVTNETGGAQAAGGAPGNGGAGGYQAAGGSPQAGGNVGAGGLPGHCGQPGHAGASSPGDPNCNAITCGPDDAACVAEAHSCVWVPDLTFEDCAPVRFADGSYASRAWICSPSVVSIPTCALPPAGTPTHDPSVATWCCPVSAAPVKP